LGDRVRFGVEGQYNRKVSGDGNKVADSSRFAVDVAPGADQAIRISTRRKILPGLDEADDSRFAAHAVDWSGATGAGSRASVSARLISQSNLILSQAPNLFARDSRAFEVM